MSEGTNKKTALNNAVSQIEKQFGKGSIMKLGGKEVVRLPAISSGCIALDIVTGIGGYPRGRVMRNLRQRGIGQNHAGAARHCRGSESGGICRFHRRRTCS